MEVGTTQLF